MTSTSGFPPVQAPALPKGHFYEKDLARLKRLAFRMDEAYRLPIVNVRLGWDAILGLVPGIGDLLALLPSAYIIREAQRMGVPTRILLRMVANSGIDLALGSVPLVGDLFDIGWKSKSRNVALLEGYLVSQSFV